MHAPHQDQEHHHGLGTDDEYDQLLSEGSRYNMGEQEGHEVPIEGKHSRGGSATWRRCKANLEIEGRRGENLTYDSGQEGRSHKGGHWGGDRCERGKGKGAGAGGYGGWNHTTMQVPNNAPHTHKCEPRASEGVRHESV